MEAIDAGGFAALICIVLAIVGFFLGGILVANP